MKKWLIIYESGYREIIEAEDFYDIHAKTDADQIVAAVRLDVD